MPSPATDHPRAHLLHHMPAVQTCSAQLDRLHSTWETLSLLGQLSGINADMRQTRQAFSVLSDTLIEQMAEESQRKLAGVLKSQVQVAIDILVRNLYERTADIGFLATDEQVQAYLAGRAGRSEAEEVAAADTIRERFREYVAKYSVYSDVVLLDTQGQVLVRLDANPAQPGLDDSLVSEALRSGAPYVEYYGPTRVVSQTEDALVYAHAVDGARGGPVIGALCLCFRFRDETERIFRRLVPESSWTVVSIVDAAGRVIASSDAWQIPVGAPLPAAHGQACRPIRFAGREYLAVSCRTHGYQGYMGPGWAALAMVPMEHAFTDAQSEALPKSDESVWSNAALETSDLFPAALGDTSRQAAAIQRELNRIVWNGSVRHREQKAANNGFAKVLLGEVSKTGKGTQALFDHSIDQLHRTVISSIVQETGRLASLAIDIMDRNLYERANDCRWWALTAQFAQALREAPIAPTAAASCGAVLARINALYTVYSTLLLLDRSGRVIAASNAQGASFVDQTLTEPWVRAALELNDAERYVVSPFEPTALYGDRPTYVYAAAVRDGGNSRAVGVVAIVFDAEPQFTAMLHDSLPRDAEGNPRTGSFAVFVDPGRKVIASTHEQMPVGTVLPMDALGLPALAGVPVVDIVTWNGHHYAIGARMSGGYREYKSGHDAYRNDVIAVVFMPLAAATEEQSKLPAYDTVGGATLVERNGIDHERVELATFHVGSHWVAIRSETVLEAIAMREIANAPRSSPTMAGVMMYDGQAMALIDLAELFGCTYQCPVETRQIIIVECPELEGRFGLVVDALAAIPEVPTAALEAPPRMATARDSLWEHIVNFDGRLLAVTSPRRLGERAGVGSRALAVVGGQVMAGGAR
ncbi:MAG: chemotaxis protein CheW [Betaproteobacteria bacterium]